MGFTVEGSGFGVVQRFKFPQYQLKWPAIKITKGTWLALFEVLLIAIWAIWVGRGMLEFDAERIPPGTEFPWVIQTHIIWRMLPRCGLCMLWNGSLMGVVHLGLLNYRAPFFTQPQS